MIDKHLRDGGHKVRSFNTNWDAELAAAKGGDLVVTCIGDHLVLPTERHDLLPISYDENRAEVESDRRWRGTEDRGRWNANRVAVHSRPAGRGETGR